MLGTEAEVKAMVLWRLLGGDGCRRVVGSSPVEPGRQQQGGRGREKLGGRVVGSSPVEPRGQ